jgi:hypothetical protein
MAFPSNFVNWTYKQDITLPSTSATITDFVFPLFTSASDNASNNLSTSIWTEAKPD